MTDELHDLDVRDNPADRRYEALLGGRVVGFSQYRLIGERVVFLHTEIDPGLAGRGAGTQLVQAALDDIRSRGRRITSKCPFVSAWLERHPEYADLVAPPGT